MHLVAGAHVTPGLRLVRLLAEGGMGHVWVADHLALDIQVAVKFVRENVARQDPTLLDRFHREAQAATRIKSPHVVQVFDHGSTPDGVAYIVMELLEGETLAARLGQSGPFGLGEVLSIAEQTAGVLEKAHALGIFHRDIKPENLFLTDVGQQPFLKVLDFGLAKFDLAGGEDLTRTGAVLGTPAYMSPEQFRSSRHATELGDLWALAVTIYKLLTGRLPFESPSPAGVAVAVCTLDFAPIHQYRDGLPAALGPWFARALAKEPRRRFPSAHELVVTFAEALGQGKADVLRSTRGPRSCLTDEEIVEMVEGRLSDREMTHIERHLDRCNACCELVGAALQGDAAAPGIHVEQASAPLGLGSILGHRYRLERWLGNGALGAVYDATDLLLEERVALKTMPASTDEAVVRALLRDIRLARRLTHPHLCPVHDLCLYEEQRGACLHFATTAFIEGETLRALLRRGPLPVRQATTLSRTLLLALAAAHAGGVLLGALRAEDVMLRDGAAGVQPVVLDVGLAAALTVRYGSGRDPAREACGAGPLEPDRDLFAWAALAVEMLTGERPPPGSRLAANPPLLPPRWRQVLEACLAPDAGPFPTATSILAALDVIDNKEHTG